MKRLFFLMLILIVSENGFSQTNYYVSNSGDNSSNGSISSPFLNIQTALNLASVGDTIYVRSGSYAEKLLWTNSGIAGNSITLTSYNNESVTLSGVNASNASQGSLILINSKSHIRINGIIFADNIMNNANGILATGAGTDIKITNCEFYNIGWSASKSELPSPINSAHAIIFVGTTEKSYNAILIKDNYIHDCITGFSESITMAGNVESFRIENNTLEFNTNIGIDVAGHFSWTGAPADVNYARNGKIKNNVVSNFDGPVGLDAAGGIYIDGGSFITVENNTVFNYKVGFSVGCEVPGKSNEGNILRNNLAYNCSLSGLFLGSNTTSIVYNTKIYNNTFYKCGTGIYDNGQIALQNNSGSDIRNNIMYASNGRYAMVQFDGTTSANPSIAYNLFWRDSANTTNLFYEISVNVQNSVLSNPQLVNTADKDFHLSGSSPAMDAGDPNYNPIVNALDIDGESRIVNGNVDIGVDEYEATLEINSFNTKGIEVYPNPTNGVITIVGASYFNYKIFSLQGQLIRSKIHSLESIDLTFLNDGLYFILFFDKNGSEVFKHKIIKK